MPFEVSIILIIVISYIFTKIARLFHLSNVIGLIVAGLLIASPFLGEMLIATHSQVIKLFGHISVMALMFLAGLEVSWSMLMKEERSAFIITISTVFTSLFLGVIVMLFLGFPLTTALIMGVCFGITAEATKARALIQLKKLNSRVGALLMGIGIINDIIGVIFLVGLTFVVTKEFATTDIILLFGVIISFALGIWVHFVFNRHTRGVKIIEKILFIFVVPFFFVSMGQLFHWELLIMDYKLLAIVVLTASTGQILGVYFTRPFTHLRPLQLWLVGWGMNSKGLVELAIAFVALEIGLLPVSLYSALVITALVTTIIFQILIFSMVRRNPKIMD